MFYLPDSLRALGKKSAQLLACTTLTTIISTPLFAEADCNPLSLNTCGLPFPANAWTQPSSESPTGLTLTVNNDIVRPEIMEQLPVDLGISPKQIFEGHHGFSAASAVVFEFDNAPDESTLPKLGGSAVLAFDTTTGEMLDIRAQVNNYARSGKVSAPSQVLEVFPMTRWAFGHTILVVVTKELNIPGETTDLNWLLENNPEQNSEYVTNLMDALDSFDIDTANVRNATLFTVRDREEVLEPVRNLVEKTFAAEHPIRNVEVHYQSYFGRKAALITGELVTHNYRKEDGIGLVDFDAEPKEQWIPFRLTLPRKSRQTGSVPVAFYAHGLGLNKGSDIIQSNINSGLGIATFSVDFPNHGARSAADGGYVMLNLHISKLTRSIGMMTQHTIDFAAAHKALIGLADLDVVGAWNWASRCWKCADGIPDIDPSRVFMQGTSLGGVLGSSYAALSPDLMGASFHVAGVGVTSILAGSILWDVMFSNLEPSAANGAEALMLKGAIQQMLDHGDSINYIDLMRNPGNGQAPRPLMVLVGDGDNIVTNDSTVALAQLLDMPLVGKKYFDMPGVMETDDYDEQGFGVIQLPALAADLQFLIGSLLTDASAHLSFFWTSTATEQKEWIKRYMLNEAP